MFVLVNVNGIFHGQSIVNIVFVSSLKNELNMSRDPNLNSPNHFEPTTGISSLGPVLLSGERTQMIFSRHVCRYMPMCMCIYVL